MKYLKFYITPVISSLLVIQNFLGGPWMWLGFSVALLLLVGGDAVLGSDYSEPKYEHPRLLLIPLFLALPVLSLALLTLAWSSGGPGSDLLGLGGWLESRWSYPFLETRSLNQWHHYLGAILGVGILVAGYGTNVAHELTHQTGKKLYVTLGRWILSMSGNADFSIEHVFGHHAHVGTNLDPATAVRGENVYRFFVRSTVLGHVSAWKIETERLKKLKAPVISFQNQMLTGYAMTAFWVLGFAWAGGAFGVLLFAAQALFAKFILEVVNYMEHYGLERKPDKAVKPHHSWNSNKRMSFWILYSLVRHSAHHERAKVSFWKLNAYPEAPEMPYGYLTTILICLVPPLWFSLMDPKLREWDSRWASVS